MIKIKNKIEFEDNLWIGKIDASLSNNSQEERINFVTDIESITYGRLGQSYSDEYIEGQIGKKRLKLYNKLLTEAADKASSPFEFVPVKILNSDLNDILKKSNLINPNIVFNKIYKYSYLLFEHGISKNLLTNMRTLLNAGIKEEDIPFNTPEELEGFKVIIGKLPKIAYDHIITHRSLSRIAESSRNKRYLNTVEFWKNLNFNDFIQEGLSDRDIALLDDLKTSVLDHDLKAEDATKELSCRRLMLSGWGGWLQDENGWLNLIKQREVSHTQVITTKVVEQIKKITNK